MISDSVKLYKNVTCGKNVTIEDQCIIGVPPRGATDGEFETIIGDNSHIRLGTIIYAGNTIGDDFQTGNRTNIREHNNIGNNVSIGALSVIEHHVDIKDGVRIHTQVFVPEYTSILKNAWIGPNVVCTNAMYPKSPGVKNHLKGPTIGEDSIIGANSTLLPGVLIGGNAVVGAGSVVTKNVEVNTVVCGNPAKFLRNKSELPY